MEIFIINLARRSDRKLLMERQLQRLGLVGTWISAVDGQDVADLPNGTLVSKTAHACWLSHVTVLTRFATERLNDTLAVVLEDDAVLDQRLDWTSFLNSLPDAMARHNLDYLQLGFVSEQYGVRWKLQRGLKRRISQEAQPVLDCSGQNLRLINGESLAGTHCYVVSRRFAETVRYLNQPVWSPADGFYDRLASSTAATGALKMARLSGSLVGQQSRGSGTRIDSDVTW